MEFSVAQSLEGHSEFANVPFPHMKSDPSTDNVNPGLGQIVNLFDTIVPVRGHSLHAIEKRVEEVETPIAKVEDLKDHAQTGFGNSSLAPDLLNSFLHPIVTDSIVFPKVEATEEKKVKRKNIMKDSTEPATKKVKGEHKFKVI